MYNYICKSEDFWWRTHDATLNIKQNNVLLLLYITTLKECINNHAFGHLSHLKMSECHCWITSASVCLLVLWQFMAVKF